VADINFNPTYKKTAVDNSPHEEELECRIKKLFIPTRPRENFGLDIKRK